MIDRERNGFLHYPQVADFFRRVDRRTTHEELVHLMRLVHTLDIGNRGHMTFQDVLRVLRAVELKSPRGDHARGFKLEGNTPQRITPPTKDDFSSWVMEAYSGATRGSKYLIDIESSKIC